MPDVMPERVAMIAQAARIRIQSGTAERVATAVSPAVKRLSEAGLEIPFEIEPASFIAEQQKELHS